MKKILPFLLSVSLGFSLPLSAGQTKDMNNLPSLDEAIISVLVEKGHQPDNIYSVFWDSNNINPFLNISSIERYMFDCSDFIFPVRGKLLSRFGSRSGRMHTGLDIKLQLGDTVSAVQSGKVRFAKYYYGYGNMVIVRHNNGVETLYSHLSKICVNVDQVLKVGDLVGLGGSTGRATCTHLHFEVRVLGRPVNPELFYDFSNFELKAPRYATLNGQSSIKPMTSPLRSTTPKLLTSNEPAQIVPKVQEGREAIYVSEVKESPLIAHTSEESSTKKSSSLADSKTTAAPVLAQEAPVVKSTSSVKEKSNEKVDEPTPEYHVLQRGETLFSLSKKYNVSIDELCEWNDLTKKSRLNVGQKIAVSMNSSTSDDQPIAAATEVPSKEVLKTIQKPIYHKIRSGENLSLLSNKYGVKVSDICRYNKITTRTKLFAGKTLIVGYKEEVVEQKLADRHSTKQSDDKKELAQASTSSKSSTVAPKSSTSSQSKTSKRYHTVRSGDNLYDIAKRYGTTVRELCGLNNISTRTTLRLGQKLRYE